MSPQILSQTLFMLATIVATAASAYEGIMAINPVSHADRPFTANFSTDFITSATSMTSSAHGDYWVYYLGKSKCKVSLNKRESDSKSVQIGNSTEDSTVNCDCKINMPEHNDNGSFACKIKVKKEQPLVYMNQDGDKPMDDVDSFSGEITMNSDGTHIAITSVMDGQTNSVLTEDITTPGGRLDLGLDVDPPIEFHP